MSELQGLLIALLAGGVGGGALVWLSRRLGPLVAKLIGGVVAVRRELDTDRDRIIRNLREEVADYARRLELEEEQSEELSGQLEEARKRIALLEAVIGELARRMGTTRGQLEREVTRT